jgi:histidyl-tRNA synthetase
MVKKNLRKAKVPKGTRDFGPPDVYIRKYLFDKMISYFEKYGGLPIDTPVIECMETVTNIYGEEFDKQVYKLEKSNQNEENDKEDLLLRYDLTVPGTRYMANNGIVSFKRYQFGKVYRRDTPNIKNGRYREFYQCDFDIIGSDNGQMIQETEILQLIDEILSDVLGDDTYTIKLNSKGILFKILESFNIDKEKYSTVSSTIDKLDKQSINELEAELVEKGINETTANTLMDLLDVIIKLKDSITPIQLLNWLVEQKIISSDDNEYNNLATLFEYLNSLNILNKIDFDPSLARGLDYYTGIIYEVVYKDKSVMSSTIVAGGRYDEMYGKLGNKNDVPMIGVSFGIERIVTILEKQNKDAIINVPTPQVFVATVSKNMIMERTILCLELRRAGLRTDMLYSSNPKMGNQFNYVFENKIPFMVIIGDNEIKKNVIKIKNIDKHEEFEIGRQDGINYLIKELNK